MLDVSLVKFCPELADFTWATTQKTGTWLHSYLMTSCCIVDVVLLYTFIHSFVVTVHASKRINTKYTYDHI